MATLFYYLFAGLLSSITLFYTSLAWRQWRRQRLANPVLNGVCLPAVDDIRWKQELRFPHQLWDTSSWPSLGKFHIDGSRVELETTDGKTAYRTYQLIGYWGRYTKQVRKHLHAQLQSRIEAAALKSIEEAE